MNEPRKHHYVPQTYLKNFCIPGKAKKIYVYDKINNKKFETSIQDIAAERDFYRVNDREDACYWEHYYSQEFETKYPYVIQTITAVCTLSIHNAIVLDLALKESLASMICVQLLRTKKARENHFEVGKRVSIETLEQLKTSLKSHINQEQKECLNKFQLTEEQFKGINLPIINDVDRLKRLTEYILNKNWMIYFNAGFDKVPYITSDHPVCYYNVASQNTGFEDNGLAVSTTIILFPITSKIAIALYPRDLYFGSLSEFDGRMIVVNDDKFIKWLNAMQIEQCYRQVYSSKE